MASVYRRGYWATVRGRKVRKQCQTFTVQWADHNCTAGKDGRVRPHTIRGYDIDSDPEGRKSKELGERAELLAYLRSRNEPPTPELLEWIAKLPEEVRADLAREGVLDPRPELRRQPLTVHLADYRADLEATGRDAEYVYIVERRLEKLREALGWRTLADITGESFTSWRAARAGKLAPKTLNQFLQALQAFLKWCRQQNPPRLESDPLAGVRPVDGRGKERRKRRALTLEELDKLMHVAATVLKDDRNRPMPRRDLVYKVALYCQLRRADLKAIRWADVQLDVLPAYLVTRAETAKGKRDTRHPLRSDLAAELRAWRPEGVRPSARLFPYIPGIKQFRADLVRAGVEYKDDMGRQADFHALGRQTPNTLMAVAGVAPRTAQELMRHTDIKLTMGPYIDPNMLNKAEAVESLPEFGKGKHLQAESPILKMEGTTGGPVDAVGGAESTEANTEAFGVAKPTFGPDGHQAGKRGKLSRFGETGEQKASGAKSKTARKPLKTAGKLTGDGGAVVGSDGVISDFDIDKVETGPLGLEPRTS